MLFELVMELPRFKGCFIVPGAGYVQEGLKTRESLRINMSIPLCNEWFQKRMSFLVRFPLIFCVCHGQLYRLLSRYEFLVGRAQFLSFQSKRIVHDCGLESIFR